MDPAALVALITGIVTAAGTLGATALAANRAAAVERWRAEHNLRVERERREHERRRARSREVRRRMDEVRRSVLQLDLSMRHIAQLRRHGPPGQGGNDLAEQVRQARSHVFEAVIAVERVRDVVPPEHQETVDGLRKAVDRALGHVQVRTNRSGGAEQVHQALATGLRSLAEALPETGGSLVRWSEGEER